MSLSRGLELKPLTPPTSLRRGEGGGAHRGEGSWQRRATAALRESAQLAAAPRLRDREQAAQVGPGRGGFSRLASEK